MSAAPPLSDVLLEVDGAIATVTLNRPEQRNPLSSSMIRDLRLALDWCKQEAAVSVVVLTFATPEINVGVWPMMIQAILCRKLPMNVVLEMILLGDRWTAAQLHQYGLVNRIVPADQLDGESHELAVKVTEKSTAIMRLGRDAFYRQQDMDFKAALEYLHSQVALVTMTEDSAEGRKAFFEKRKPRFTGR